MARALSPSHAGAERETHYRALLALYRPPSFLTKRHKDLLKTAWSIRQGYDGTKLSCEMCGELKSFAEITIHHRDGVVKHNDPDNLAPACWECNRREGWVVRRRQIAQAEVRERELRAQAASFSAPAPPGESESLQRHKEQRLAFNLWLYHPKTGLPEGAVISKRGIAYKAVDVVGKGSNKTYREYLEEDIVGGYWQEVETKDGIMVERTAKPFPLERMGMKEPEKTKE